MAYNTHQSTHTHAAHDDMLNILFRPFSISLQSLNSERRHQQLLAVVFPISHLPVFVKHRVTLNRFASRVLFC